VTEDLDQFDWIDLEAMAGHITRFHDLPSFPMNFAVSLFQIGCHMFEAGREYQRLSTQEEAETKTEG
jgi:hypothetical protein